MQKVITGRVYKFGDNINTDVIYPGKYLSITHDREEMARHCFEAVYPDFLKQAHRGDIIIAGKNFGCGSSREQAAACLKYFGIKAIVAESFARIFYRNAINLGLPVIVAPHAGKMIEHRDMVEIDLRSGLIKNSSSNKTVTAAPLPEFILNIMSDGGLIPYLRRKLGIEQQED